MMIMVKRLPSKVDHKVVVIFSPKCSEEEWVEWENTGTISEKPKDRST